MTEPVSTLLVVDDEELNRDVLSRRLRRAGFAVVTAADGAEALAAIATGNVDLVLLDIMMPGVSGLDVLRTIRATPASAQLPVVMVTAKVQAEDVVEALELGADDYVTKPVNFAVTLARVRTQLAKRRAERALRESEERYTLAVEGTNDGVWDWRVDTGQVFYSPRWREIMGVGPDEVIDIEAWFVRLHPDDQGRVREDFRRHAEDRSGQLESESRVRIGETYRWILIRGKAVRNSSGRAVRVAGSVTDITGGKVADALTGLPNRVLFDDRLGRLFEHAKRVPGYEFAVLFLDLDRFKNVNDSLGHDAGDQLLVEIARRLERKLRATDSVSRLDQTGVEAVTRAVGHTIARFGGDEFGIILGGVHRPSDATLVADRLVRVVSEPATIAGQEVFVSASIGIALSASSYSRPADMLRDADTALYRAKASGRGRYELFDAAMRADVLRTVETERDLRRTLSEGGFVLHYQPIVEISNGTVAGLEALLRWQHPTRGLVMPGDFISIAEDTGLIVPIGYWVIGEVCRQMHEWAAGSSDGTHPVVAINVSRRQLQMSDFVSKVLAIVDAHRLPHSSFEFELTESVVMTDPEDVRQAIDALNLAGFRISIDDFGTGYSSLSTLQRLPVDRLKLDRSFLEDVAGDSEARQVMEGIMLLAEHLKLEVVAEGIETVQHLKRVQGMNCPFGQGYLFSRPAPPGPQAVVDLRGAWYESPAKPGEVPAPAGSVPGGDRLAKADGR